MNKAVIQKTSIFACVLFLAFLTAGCDKKKSTLVKASATGKTAPALGNVYDDIAHFIAGMTVDSASALSPLTKTPAWQKYHAAADSNWSRFQKNVDLIHEWTRSELKNVYAGGDVFYPFSGPDFLYAFSFFPDANRYTLFGLEPVGVVPEPVRIPSDSLESMFCTLDRNIEYALKATFFRTRNMRTELASRTVQGTVPILMYFAARTGNHITGVKPFQIDSTGSIAYCDSFKATGGKRVFGQGVEIRFQKDTTGKEQTMVYFAADVSNGGLEANLPCKRLLEKLPQQQATYLKAAAYLMYQRDFKTIRDAILTKSDLILQDDSGIPYRYFLPSKWVVALYGRYSKPFDEFKNYLDDELKKAYAARNPKPLSLRFGYQKNPNLLLAVKKQL
jgi:hypothetical protein